MSNYPYIIAGLPDLILDFESKQFDYDELEKSIIFLCDESDVKRIKWFDASLDGKHNYGLFNHCFAKVASRFMKNYIGFDKDVRTAKVKYLQEGTFEEESPLRERLEPVFKISNLIDRERALDKLYWDKINELILQEYLTFDVILAFLAKAKIVERWTKLDKARGAELFSQLVKEVRGTFKGVEFE